MSGKYENDNYCKIWKYYRCDIEGCVTERKLTPIHNSAGYMRVPLSGKGFKSGRYFVHRLVASFFLPNFKNKPTVEHIDKNRQNNRLYNLKWYTVLEQHQYRLNENSFIHHTKSGLRVKIKRGKNYFSQSIGEGLTDDYAWNQARELRDKAVKMFLDD